MPETPKQRTQKMKGDVLHPSAGDMLKTDHQKVEALFKQYEAADDIHKQALAKQIFNELEVHSLFEEEIFYPAVREQVPPKEFAELSGEEEEETEEAGEEISGEAEESLAEESEDIIDFSYEEHQAMKDLIQELKKLDHKSDAFKERWIQLKEDVILPAAQMHLKLEDLGAMMEQRRIDLVSSMSGEMKKAG